MKSIKVFLKENLNDVFAKRKGKGKGKGTKAASNSDKPSDVLRADRLRQVIVPLALLLKRHVTRSRCPVLAF